MAQKAIREYSAKQMLSKHWETYFPEFRNSTQCLLVHSSKELAKQAQDHPWLHNEPLVIKPDMLFGKRGLNQLVYLQENKPGDVNLKMAQDWINTQTAHEKILICGTKGKLQTFIVEPFVKHGSSEEIYLSCTTAENGDILRISSKGGVNIEDHWESVKEILIPIDYNKSCLLDLIESNLPKEAEDKKSLAKFSEGFYHFFKDLHFAYLELNPLVMIGNKIFILDTVAKLDDTARFLMQKQWGEISFPTAFGEAEATPIEKDIQKLDQKSGASLKLTVLNSKGLIWTLVAGGGASVVYADSIASLWGVDEMANYGEYSGNPSTEETYCYAKGVIDLMTKEKDPNGREKVLIIGGSIANFTDVAKTFDGIIKAFKEMHTKMKEVGVKIYVRRGGPNYEIGLKNIENAAKQLHLPIYVYGPETHLTDIVRQALIMQNKGANV